MKQDELDLRQALDYIDPRELSYSEWVGVGMGLKEAGYPVGLWEDWSRRDGGATAPASAPASGTAFAARTRRLLREPSCRWRSEAAGSRTAATVNSAGTMRSAGTNPTA